MVAYIFIIEFSKKNILFSSNLWIFEFKMKFHKTWLLVSEYDFILFHYTSLPLFWNTLVYSQQFGWLNCWIFAFNFIKVGCLDFEKFEEEKKHINFITFGCLNLEYILFQSDLGFWFDFNFTRLHCSTTEYCNNILF